MSLTTNKVYHSRWQRRFKASWRDTLLLLKQFRIPLFLFIALVVGCGIIYHSFAKTAGEPVSSLPESVYKVLSLIFLQSSGEFPQAWYLQLFYFLMPVAGIGILAQGLADFGVLFFNRKARGKEWEMAVASTFNNHVVLIGLGHLGYRVATQLFELEQDVVVVELKPKPELAEDLRAIGIPVIQDDGTRELALQAAGVAQARAIILCTQNDVMNLHMALNARGINPGIQVIIRIFDDDFAASLQKQFGFTALSATGMAAPIFAASAAGVDITPPISIEGQPNSLARILITRRFKLTGKTIADIESAYNLSVVLLCRENDRPDLHPAGTLLVSAGDTLAVLGEPVRIHQLVHDN